MAKTVYIGIVGDIIHPGIINIINEGAKRGEVIVGLFPTKRLSITSGCPTFPTNSGKRS